MGSLDQVADQQYESTKDEEHQEEEEGLPVISCHRVEAPNGDFDECTVKFDDVYRVVRTVKIVVPSSMTERQAIAEAQKHLMMRSDRNGTNVDVVTWAIKSVRDDNVGVGVNRLKSTRRTAVTKRRRASFIAWKDEGKYYDGRRFIKVSGDSSIDHIWRSAEVFEMVHSDPPMFRLSLTHRDHGVNLYGNGGSIAYALDTHDYKEARRYAIDFVERRWTPEPEDFMVSLNKGWTDKPKHDMVKA